MNVDRYLTLSSESGGLYREKASKFIAYAFPITDGEDFAERCAVIGKEHHTCRHVCYAWVLGESGDRHRANDAGEPSGTAGKPILRRLQGARLTYAAIVVVRYFGGTLLGKGGLVHAYSKAARLALVGAAIVEHVVGEPLNGICGYALVESVKNDVVACEGVVAEADYGERCVVHIAMARNAIASFTLRCRIVGAIVTADQPK